MSTNFGFRISDFGFTNRGPAASGKPRHRDAETQRTTGFSKCPESERDECGLRAGVWTIAPLNPKSEIRNPKSWQSEIRNPKSTGVVLVAVLLLVAVLSVIAVTQVLVIRSEAAASAAAWQGYQARAAARSGIQRACALLLENADPAARDDNPTWFQAQPLERELEGGWRFTVYAEKVEENGELRYGLEDEAGKLNVNLASEQMLMALPGMSQELVDCLLDFRDADSNPRPSGAEQEYYDALPHPYRIPNGPLMTLEELLLVKGFTGAIVLGEDANRNGLLEPNERDGKETFPPDDGDGQLNLGLRRLLTALTYEPNVSNDGQKRINIVRSAPNQLATQLAETPLEENVRNFIVQLRRQGGAVADPSHLLGMKLEAPDPRNPNQKTTLDSGVNAGNLAVVMDRLTCGGINFQGQELLFGRVNVNSAPAEVLSALPGLDAASARAIVDARGSLEARQRSTTAWLVSQNVLSPEVFKRVSPLITARSCQYRVRSFGYHASGGRFCVLEAIIDVARGKPQVTYLRDLTALGVPFSPSGEER